MPRKHSRQAKYLVASLATLTGIMLLSSFYVENKEATTFYARYHSVEIGMSRRDAEALIGMPEGDLVKKQEEVILTLDARRPEPMPMFEDSCCYCGTRYHIWIFYDEKKGTVSGKELCEKRARPFYQLRSNIQRLFGR